MRNNATTDKHRTHFKLVEQYDFVKLSGMDYFFVFR